MAHLHDKEARRSFGSKVSAMVGERGEHPQDRAARITGIKVDAESQGLGSARPEEEWAASPARQVSNLGNVRK